MARDKYWECDSDDSSMESNTPPIKPLPPIIALDDISCISTIDLVPRSRHQSPSLHELQDNHIKQLTFSLDHHYDDPDVDTDEELGDIDPEFNRAKGTKSLKLRIVDRWHRFCQKKAENVSAHMIWSQPEDALRKVSADCIYQFLNWCFKLEHGKDGRKLKGYGQANSFQTDWKYFRGYYQEVTGRKMDRDMKKSLRTARQWLIHKYGLSTQSRENKPVYIEDMIPFNETILQTRKKRFHLGIQRIMLCLALMLGLFTAGRKNAILKLQYKHLYLSLLRDPRGGPPILSIDIRPEYIKQFLGITNLNTFSFPEIIYGVSLVFSPHVFIMGLLLHAGAFKANIRSMDDLRSLFVMRGCQELPLPLKTEMDDHFLFCKVDVIDGQPKILRDQPMSDSQYSSAVRTISEVLGLMNWFFFHQFRYGTGKILDKTEWVSDSERNLVLNHATTATFLKYYRPRQHTQMQQVVLGLEPDDVIDRALTSIRRYADARRPRYLDDTQKAFVEGDPELQAAISEREALQDEFEKNPIPTLAFDVAEAERNVRNTRQRLRYKRKKEVRRAFSDEQAVKDSNAQLAGTLLSEDDILEESQPEDDTPPEQVMLVESLMAIPVKWDLEGEWQRRNVGTAAIISYCDFEEGGPLRGRRPKRKPVACDDGQAFKKVVHESKESKKLSIAEIKREEDQEHIRTAKKPRICFQCGKKYAQYQSLLRHFRPAHLNDTTCNFCDDGMEYLYQMHWQKHAEAIHRLST